MTDFARKVRFDGSRGVKATAAALLYAYEHRVVAEQKLGRRLRRVEIVHHKDGNRQNNRPGNIEVMETAAHHFAEHRMQPSRLRPPGAPNPMVACACGCKTMFRRYDGQSRPRRFISGHNAGVHSG